MRLKSIKLAGFKSFVDPTTAHFPSNLSAVVGPNGCGKSNIIDAVRWVMGESSAKNLRGESMTDVIFNGSVNRKPVGQASIELVFDNTAGKLGGEYARFNEIAIRRKVTREGSSEYYLNGTKCRRRDITDIFLGTGLGPRSYAIIEQGMISRLIESKPEELRVFIEEAAGISKYKERRRETENRMRRTLENLERLTDLRDELERQLQHLQRQAAAAEKYTEYKKEERLLKAQLQVLQWKALDGQVSEKDAQIRELELERESIVTEQVSLGTNIEQARDQHTQLNDEFNEVQGRYYSIGADIARVEQSISHQQERRQQLDSDLQRLEVNIQETARHLDSDREKIRLWEEEIGGIEPDLEITQAEEESAAESLMVAEEAMQSWQQRWDEFNHRAAEPRQQAEVQQSRIQHLEHALKRLQARIEQLAGEQRELAPADGEEDPAPLREELAEAELAIAGYEEQGEALADDLAATREQGTRIASELDAARSELAQLRGRQASLEALQQAAAEDASGGADAWLDGNGLAAAPRLLSQLDVAAPWQRAVETVLGDYLQAVCVDDLDSLGRRLDGLSAGHLTLVARAPEPPAPAGTLAAEVNCGGRVAGLLAAVRTAADEAEALALRGQLAGHESVITPEGLWLGPNWLSLRRGDAEGDGVIRRQQELEALSASVASTAERVRELESAQAAESGRLRDLESARQALQREQQAASRRQADAAAQLKAQEARVEQLEARRAALARDAEDARAQFEGEQASIAEARQVLAAAIERMESDAGEREALLSERDRLRAELDGCRQAARQARDSAHQAAMRLRSLQTQVETIRSSIARTEAQVAQLSERRAGLASGLEESSTPVAGLEAELETQLQLRSAAEAELTEARQRVAEVEHALRSDEQARAAIEQRVATARAELEQCRLGRQTLQVQRENVGRQLKELSQAPDAVLEGLPEEATREGWQQQLERVATRIARLGPINLAAIDEYSQQSERKQYLDAQNEDLESALATLESAIRKIDRETRSRFQATFDKVNSGLQELFPRVFGGGSAYLEMTGDDLLDTGISIMARPPGKKNSTIHLLSGGEKALTAIALVFSIFQLNPAPFCMLDEVDAPLDDANVGRYARMVKEMSEKVQFIFITHNKITMELADQLLGVTMHEPGVSRLVAVDVEEAAELAAS